MRYALYSYTFSRLNSLADGPSSWGLLGSVDVGQLITNSDMQSNAYLGNSPSRPAPHAFDPDAFLDSISLHVH
jgi:hypothetical protein